MIGLCLLVIFSSAIGQNFSFNYGTNGARVCLAEAEVDMTAPSVKIKLLDAASNTTNITKIYRRPLYAPGSAWVLAAASLPAGTTQWIDVNVNAGEVWEYQVKRIGTWSYNSQAYNATGYTVGSLMKDNSNYQGRMILLVADNISTGLAAKYKRLKKELTGEGWFVNELIVPKAVGWDNGNAVVGIRNQIATLYNNAPANDKPKVLFILGHVPMPRSGSTSVTSPDGHNQNMGARGCDGYYADINGVYTDTTATFNPGGLQTPLAINLPGDYKWDQDFFPSSLEMAFGRVDFEDLTSTTLTELQFTENYLDRLSSYKTVAAGFDMGNKTGFFYGYDNSNDGSYRTLPDLSKAANVYQNTAGAPHPQWVQTNGPFKVYMQNSNFPDLTEWTTYGMNATVYSSDQSYWGFNDEPQDFYYSRIRALLSLNTKCLVTLWTTSAINSFHQACMGDPLGLAVKETMNHNPINNNVEKPQQNWDAADWWNRTHLSYNGDPTLRLYQLSPASTLTITNQSNTPVLSWTASPDALVTGYHLYKSSSEFGIFNRITSISLSALSYTLTNYVDSTWYMVRAVKTEESGCGKFINPSMGTFVLGANLGFTTTTTGTTTPTDTTGTPTGTTTTSIIERTEDLYVRIFPNPANCMVYVDAGYDLQSLQMMSSDGRLVLELTGLHTKQLSINVSSLAQGIYILKISGKEKTVMRKVVIK